jgi:hypothetical protein
MRSSRARCLLGCALACLLAGAEVLPSAPAAAADDAAASPSAARAADAVTVEGRVHPSRLAIKRHGYYYNVSAHNLAWSGWGQAQTTGQGTFTFQFCVEESCSASPFYDEPVVVVLSAIKRCRGRLSYTTLTLDVEASMPDSSFKGYRASLGSCPGRGSRGH